MQRLLQDMQKHAALREALGAELKQCSSTAEAAARLRQRGYAIQAEDLTVADTTLPDHALDQVAGGTQLNLGSLLGGPLLAALDEQVKLAKGPNWPG